MTGGGAKIPKIVELAKKELKLPCRIGKPQGFEPNQNDPSLSTVCGLVLSGTDSEEEGWQGPNWPPFFGKDIGLRVKRIFKIFIP